jgi:hypothetical protein
VSRNRLARVFRSSPTVASRAAAFAAGRDAVLWAASALPPPTRSFGGLPLDSFKKIQWLSGQSP